MTRQAKWLLPAVAMLTLVGCNCGQQPVDERRLVLTFTKPVVGAQLTAADDSDLVRSGLQTDVEVKLEWESLGDGSRAPADIELAGLAVRKNVAGESFGDAVAGTVNPGGTATFTGVTFLSNGEYLLRANAQELSTRADTGPLTITISVQNVPNRPQILTAEIVEDLNKDFRVTLSELPPPARMNLRLTAINFASGTVTVTDGVGVVVADRVAVADGTGSFVVPLNAPNPTTATDFRQYTFAILLENNVGSKSEVSANAPDTITVALDQIPPGIVLVDPVDDGGYGSRTLTALASVSGAPGATVLFEAFLYADAGAMNAGTAVVGVNGVATATISVFEGRQRLTASVSDLVGNPGSDSADFTVNTTACNITVTDPTGGAYLGPSQDAAPNDGGFDYRVVGFTTDCPNRPARVTVGGVQYFGQTDGAGAFSVQVPLQPGANTISANVDNGFGVFGPEQVVDVFVGATDFRIVAPANNAVLNRASDTDSTQVGIQTSLNWTGSPPTGSTVTVCAGLPAVPGSTPCPDGSSFIVLKANTPSVSIATFPDGVYSLRGVMLSGTTVQATTPPVSIRVDSQRPFVVMNGIALQGDANADLRLNATEQPSGPAVVVVTTSGMENGTTVTVRNSATGAVLGTGTVNNNTVTITLTTVTGPEADYPIVIELTDAAGNTNVVAQGGPEPRNDSAFATIRVDRVLPTCGFTQPTKANLGPADDGNTTLSGFQIRTECVAQADIAVVRFQASPNPAVNGTLAGTTASADLTISATGTTVYTLTATPTDSSGNTGPTASRQVTADFEAPVVTITSPNAAGSPYSQYTLPTNVSVPGDNNLTVRIYTTVGAGAEQLLGTLTVVNGTASGNITYPNGTQTVRAEVTDLAGNIGSASGQITVASTGCSIAFTAPAPGKLFWNQSDDLDRITTPLLLEYDVTGTSSNCPSRPVSIFRGTGGSRVLLASGTTSATGAFSLRISLPEGAQRIEVELTDLGNVATFVSHDATVDLQAPTLTAVTPAETTVWYVADTNLNTRGAGTAGYIKDTDPLTADAQVSLGFTANDALGGKAYVFYQGTQRGAALDVTTANQALTAAVTLPQSTTGALELRVVDAAGNTGVHAKTATVDVVAPAAPSYTATTTNLRLSTIGLSWPAVFDDGSVSTSGPPTGYDLRWTNSIHVTNGVLTEDDYFNLPALTPPKLKIETGALLPGSTLGYTLTVPPLMTSYIVLRAVDEIGNYSPFIPSTSVSNVWPQVAFNNPGTNTNFGYALTARGDVNGDGFNDFVTSAVSGTAPGQGYIYFGNANPALITAQAFGPSDGDATAQTFGFALDMGNLSHATGTAFADVVVGAPAFGINVGRVYLYFGKSPTPPDPPFDSSAANAVIFQGSAGLPIGRGISIIRDINTDGLSELLISSPAENTNRGRIYVFYGRSQTAWEMLRVGGVIPMSAANRIIEGPLPVGVGPANNSFGWGRAFAPLNLVDGDTRFDFAVATAGDTANKVFVFSGGAVDAKTAVAPATPTLTTGDSPGTPDESLQRLASSDLGGGNTRDGFGSRLFGGVDILGTSASDLLVAYPYRSRVHLYPGVAGGPFSTTSVTLSGPAYFGNAVSAGDINGDGRADVLASDAVTSASSGWLFFNSGMPGQEFDLTAGTGFRHARLPSTSSLGWAAELADINGDNRLDILLTDRTSGKVLLWY